MAHSSVYSWRPDSSSVRRSENGDLKFSASNEEEDRTTRNHGAERTSCIDYKDSERLRHTDWVSLMKMNRNDKIAAIRIRNRNLSGEATLKLLDKMILLDAQRDLEAARITRSSKYSWRKSFKRMESSRSAFTPATMGSAEWDGKISRYTTINSLQHLQCVTCKEPWPTKQG